MAGLLDGKITLVTGGSRGIGRATSIELAAHGATVAVNYNSNKEAADDVVSTIEKAGGKAAAYQADISNRDQVNAMVDQVVADHGPITILINNAGATADRTLRNMSDEQWDSVIEVNLTGTFNVTKKIWNLMGEAGGGHIVNISSIVGEAGRLGLINYATAKAGLLGFTKTAAREGARTNIHVNAIAPGFIETDMTNKGDGKLLESWIESIPLKRAGHVEDIANLCVYLASEKGSYITGQIIKVDGGLVT